MKLSNDAGTVRTKSYFADTVMAAVAQARKELGDDALLLTSVQTSEAERSAGAYKVTFVVTSESTTEDRVADVAHNPASQTYADKSLADELKSEFRQLKGELESLRNNVMRLQIPGDPEAAGLIGRLRDAGVDPELAAEIYRAAKLQVISDGSVAAGRHAGPIPIDVASRDTQALLSAISVEMEKRVLTDSVIAGPGRGTKAIALVGPSGSGKTSTLVKLAAVQGLAKKRTVRLLSTDTVRVGAAQQLRSYAAILGVPLTFVEDPAKLGSIISSVREELVLIDTPGYTAASVHSGLSLAEALSSNGTIETHLVLPASLPCGVLKTLAARFEAFAPDKLIFARMDEAESAGAVFSEAVRQARPVSFLCHGDVIPQDIEPATSSAITIGIVTNTNESVRSAA
jgi:flagellar biosynthesis protein FlhF